jgi:hypothetical protein
LASLVVGVGFSGKCPAKKQTSRTREFVPDAAGCRLSHEQQTGCYDREQGRISGGLPGKSGRHPEFFLAGLVGISTGLVAP